MRSAEGAVELLLAQDRKILQLRQEIRQACWRRRALVSVYSSAPTLFVLLLVGNVFGWRKVGLARVDIAALPILIALLVLSVVIATRSTGSFSGRKSEWESGYVAKLELDLEVELERKRLSAASLNISPDSQRHIYRDTVPVLIGQYRSDGMRYRRVHNVFQSTIIVGSLTTSTAASLANAPPPYNWITVGVSLVVGISAGFTGYFKFRERSFYLQQTADSIEEEYNSVILGVGRYGAGADDEMALLEFTQRVETLKNDQRKRQQQLDQPTENPEG